MAERKPPLILLGSRAGAGRGGNFDTTGLEWREPEWLSNSALYEGVFYRRSMAYFLDALLAFVLWLTHRVATRFAFRTEDEIAAVFCGSKKSLAAGAPMAALIFGSAGGALGLIMLPIMIYHQLQLIVCSVIARRYAQRPEGSA